jgi:cyclophilin family peptidyl-prolyl cis-trans isomerase
VSAARIRVDQPLCPTVEKAGCLVAKSQLGQVVSGVDVVDKIKNGAKEANGAVSAPNKIVKMQLAADAATSKK